MATYLDCLQQDVSCAFNLWAVAKVVSAYCIVQYGCHYCCSGNAVKCVVIYHVMWCEVDCVVSAHLYCVPATYSLVATHLGSR